MIVGFDAIRVFHNATGLGNYSRYIVRVLAQHQPGWSYRLYTPGLGGGDLALEIARLPGVSVALPHRFGGTRLARDGWRTLRLGRRLRDDGVTVFHGLSHELPRDLVPGGPATVVTMHDLIYLRRPGDFSAIDRRLYDWKFRLSCARADLVLAISEHTRRDLEELYGLPGERIRVVGQGCDPQFAVPLPASRIAAVRRRYALPSDYLLVVGTLEPRKNLELVIAALAALPRGLDPLVVVVGRGDRHRERLRALARARGVAERLRFLGDVPGADLPALYRGARLFMYPSRYEGFGIPVLEALTAGVPAVAARSSSLLEVGGDAAIYVDPDDPEALAQAIADLLHDGARAKALAALGIEHARRFDDAAIAARLAAVYREAAERRRAA